MSHGNSIKLTNCIEVRKHIDNKSLYRRVFYLYDIFAHNGYTFILISHPDFKQASWALQLPTGQFPIYNFVEVCKLAISVQYFHTYNLILFKIIPPRKKHFKVECLVCYASLDSDYRKKHNELCHSAHLKAHKQIGYKVSGAPDNPFQVRLIIF